MNGFPVDECIAPVKCIYRGIHPISFFRAVGEVNVNGACRCFRRGLGLTGCRAGEEIQSHPPAATTAAAAIPPSNRRREIRGWLAAGVGGAATGGIDGGITAAGDPLLLCAAGVGCEDGGVGPRGVVGYVDSG